MWYTPTITVAATSEPVSLAEAKRQVRATDFADDDDFLASLTSAARDHAEGYCSAKWAAQTVVVKTTCWDDFCHLPITPVSTVTSITYVDVGGDAKTLPTSVYELRGDTVVLKYGQQWPAIQSGSLVTLTAVVGFTSCPPSVKHAMLVWIADAYLIRESAALPEWTTMDALLCNHRYYP